MKAYKDPVVVFLVLILVVIFYSMMGCAAKPKDFKVCVEMSMERGECMKVMSGQKIRIDQEHKNPETGQSWWDMRPTNLILPLESWIDIKKFIIKLCKQNQGMCDKEVSTWERSIQKVDENLMEKGIEIPKVLPDPEPDQKPVNPTDDIYFG